MTTTPVIRPIEPADDSAIADIIRVVMSDFGATGQGYSSEDPEVGGMCKAYAAPRHAYFVVELVDTVIGGAGVGQLAGGDENTCE